MRNRAALPLILAVAGGVAYYFMSTRRQQPVATAAAPSVQPQSHVVAASGRIEPVSEEIKVGADVPGRLLEVRVAEGDSVRRGQVLASLDNSDVRARLASAVAQVSLKDAELRRVIKGARAEERREAESAVQEAEAVMRNAEAEMKRRQTLHRSGDISREEAERAESSYRAAQARVESARHHYAFIDAQAREEDRSRAEADLALARSRVVEAQALLDKTIIRSPINGVVLRRHLKSGENTSGSPDSPIVTLADTSRLRIRAEIDETDVAKVRVGQSAYATADAYPGKKFPGRVVQIGQSVGKKNIRTGDPAERQDTKVLETLIDLDQGHPLPPGLRVDVFIEPR